MRAICNVFDSESESEDSVDTPGQQQPTKKRRNLQVVGLSAWGMPVLVALIKTTAVVQGTCLIFLQASWVLRAVFCRDRCPREP